MLLALGVVIGIEKDGMGDALTEWLRARATAVIAILPPAAAVVSLQRGIFRRRVETKSNEAEARVAARLRGALPLRLARLVRSFDAAHGLGRAAGRRPP